MDVLRAPNGILRSKGAMGKKGRGKQRPYKDMAGDL